MFGSNKKTGIDVAASMEGIMQSPAHRAVFAEPTVSFVKTASADDDEGVETLLDELKLAFDSGDKVKCQAVCDRICAKCADDNDCGEMMFADDGDDKDDKDEKKDDKKKDDKDEKKDDKDDDKKEASFEQVLNNLVSVGDDLDRIGLSKGAYAATRTLEVVIREAEDKVKGEDKDDDKEDKKEDEKEEKDDKKGKVPAQFLKGKKDDDSSKADDKDSECDKKEDGKKLSEKGDKEDKKEDKKDDNDAGDGELYDISPKELFDIGLESVPGYDDGDANSADSQDAKSLSPELKGLEFDSDVDLGKGIESIDDEPDLPGDGDILGEEDEPLSLSKRKEPTEKLEEIFKTKPAPDGDIRERSEKALSEELDDDEELEEVANLAVDAAIKNFRNLIRQAKAKKGKAKAAR